MDTEQKLNILADSGKYDLACACKFKDEPGRVQGNHGRWIYPAALPDGRKMYLLKMLQTNACSNDCVYCPFNVRQNQPRCTIQPDQLARTFLSLHESNLVNGLFLSSGISDSPEISMSRMLTTIEILRKRHQFKGFIHLKILPGCSDAAIESAVRLATRVSVNVEAPSAHRLSQLSIRKRFREDILHAMSRIVHYSRLYKHRIDHTTQFVVGAAGESDREIITTTHHLHNAYHVSRTYFSAWQDMNNDHFDPIDTKNIPENAQKHDIFIREHRLYQAEFLLRKYKFDIKDIIFDANNNLSLTEDPKTIWARNHPDLFPVNINHCDYDTLLRIPGIGPLSAKRIIKERKKARIPTLDDLSRLNIRIKEAGKYIDLPYAEGLLWE